MSGEFLTTLLLAALLLLVLSAGIEDARTREIANWKNAAIALLAPLWWWANGLALWPGAAVQVAIGLGVFALFACAFFAGQMGGGDVKMLGALALWLPLQPLLWMLIWMSLLGGALTVAMLIDRHIRKSAAKVEIPYGVAIAIAAMMLFREPIFNPFG